MVDDTNLNCAMQELAALELVSSHEETDGKITQYAITQNEKDSVASTHICVGNSLL